MSEWLHGLSMTFKERQIYEAMKKLGGEAQPIHPAKIAEEMGISRDYAEILCREMVLRMHFAKKGLKYAIKQ